MGFLFPTFRVGKNYFCNLGVGLKAIPQTKNVDTSDSRFHCLAIYLALSKKYTTENHENNFLEIFP